MTLFDLEKDYWKNYWISHPIVDDKNPQRQVGRTVNKIPIDDRKWQFHLHEIERILELQTSDTLLDLCAGNGLIAMPLSLKCRSVTAIDISEALLKQINALHYPSISLIVGDIRNIILPPETYSKGVMYFALQYFNERETLFIFENIFKTLLPGGTFLIGDIPDIDRLFVFYNKPEWVKAYFDSIKTHTPAIGAWFKREVLLEMAKYTGFNKAEIISQHPELINSHYRFDLLLKK